MASGPGNLREDEDVDTNNRSYHFLMASEVLGSGLSFTLTLLAAPTITLNERHCDYPHLMGEESYSGETLYLAESICVWIGPCPPHDC